MGGNADIRKLLQQNLGVERAQLYRRAGTIANSLSIKTSDAILVLAAKSHINLQKHGIASAKLEEIRKLLPHVSAAIPSVAVPVAASSHTKRGKAKSKKGFKVKVVDAQDDPILSKATHAEMEAMVPVYKALYTLENSIRQFLTRVLVANHGEKWWDKLATTGLKKTHANNTKAEEVNAWHQRRSKNPIDYVDLDQLPDLVRAGQKDFVPMFFKTEGWFQHFVDEVYQSRCVVAHMNPLNQTNVDNVGIKFNQWETLVKAKIGEVRELEAGKSLALEEVSPVQPTAAVEVPKPAVAALSDLPSSGTV
jgi:Swt1-like HEPN